MFPTLEDFTRKAQEKRPLSWKKLDVYGVYRIDETREINNGRFGDALVLKM